MNQQYDNTNRGALFINDKRTQQNHPNYTGSINIEGVEYWLSGWTKESRNGKKFLSLSVKPKDTAPVRAGDDGFLDAGGAPVAADKPALRGLPAGAGLSDDDIPF